ncbi:hypothetical protein B0T24DRAFT_627567 [Lasiosphaeria ovina]|uniref:Uncharacterized protein n=1 Tax=Lasiosphaeria ovina TaxID=92902 RepID=A0AAE0K7U8_9PEZI|nr:hypothetical protein B0T24DRAFT_627567 [Lasiosphaeria ovina]
MHTLLRPRIVQKRKYWVANISESCPINFDLVMSQPRLFEGPRLLARMIRGCLHFFLLYHNQSFTWSRFLPLSLLRVTTSVLIFVASGPRPLIFTMWKAALCNVLGVMYTFRERVGQVFDGGDHTTAEHSAACAHLFRAPIVSTSTPPVGVVSATATATVLYTDIIVDTSTTDPVNTAPAHPTAHHLHGNEARQDKWKSSSNETAAASSTTSAAVPFNVAAVGESMLVPTMIVTEKTASVQTRTTTIYITVSTVTTSTAVLVVTTAETITITFTTPAACAVTTTAPANATTSSATIMSTVSSVATAADTTNTTTTTAKTAPVSTTTSVSTAASSTAPSQTGLVAIVGGGAYDGWFLRWRQGCTAAVAGNMALSPTAGNGTAIVFATSGGSPFLPGMPAATLHLRMEDPEHGALAFLMAAQATAGGGGGSPSVECAVNSSSSAVSCTASNGLDGVFLCGMDVYMAAPSWNSSGCAPVWLRFV